MAHQWSVVRRLLAVVLVSSVVATPVALAESPSSLGSTKHHLANGYRNLDPSYDYTLFGRAASLVRRAWQRIPERGTPPAVLANDGAELRANGTHPTMTWVGHATMLVQLDGVNILTDPIWSERTGPYGIGPRRLVPPGVRFEDLPPIHAVIISHDHYDHLDRATVLRLAREHHPTFFVPLGIGTWLRHEGVQNVVELDWWDAQIYRGVTFIATPAQHGSGRTLADQNERLWASWAVLGARERFFFGGDTGYTPGMAEIGRRLGPFDVAVLPIGGYSAFNVRHPNHLSPEESVQLFEDLRAKLLVPMHWGTFALNREPYREPPDRLLAEALRRGLEEQVAILSPGQSIPW
ncbi:MAG TPA: MBL fold metallo-hydrolase [Patescibacteria group bacterium]|nr:MBL fold metallo-hydrolase [Patescibacteria group bacterium]